MVISTGFLQDIVALSGIIPVILIISGWRIVSAISITLVLQVIIGLLIKRNKSLESKKSYVMLTASAPRSANYEVQVLLGAVIFGIFAYIKYKHPILVFAAPAIGICVSMFSRYSEQLLKIIGVM